jgi:hypothetical protein
MVRTTDFSWGTDGNGFWTNLVHWDVGTGHPSTINESATIALPGSEPYTVTLNVARRIGTLTFNSANAELVVSGSLTNSCAAAIWGWRRRKQ